MAAEESGRAGDDASTARKLVEQSEFGGRNPERAWLRWLLFCIAVGWSVFQLYAIYTGSIPPQQRGAIHLAFGLALAFLAYPRKNGPSGYVPWYDWVLALAGVTGSLYIVVFYFQLVAVQGGLPVTRDLWMGSVLLVVLAVAAVRLVGYALPIVAGLAVLYGATGPAGIIPLTPPDVLYLHNGYDWPDIVQQMYVTTEGLWGTPIQVSATFVFLFVLFGSLLDRAGAGQYFVALAYSGLGHFRGGPAKASVVASLLTGIVSGSSTANTVTTGTFTIPLMKRVGYPPVKAGAIECAASVNGQLMPPIMGAAAFIMATFLNIPYSEIILYALVPALLSYIGLIFVVHLEALKLGLEGMPREELPPFWSTLLSGAHYLIPVIFLLYELMWAQLTAQRSALNAVFVLIGVMFAQELWRGFRGGRPLLDSVGTAVREVLQGLERGARNMATIAVATAAAGIIVGMVTMTNLGYGLTQVIEAISGGNIWLVLIYSAITSLILGMGLPTTANYIVMASLVAPVIASLAGDAGVAVPLVAIHLFVFYFGILADDTPPVGLAAYAASAISRAEPVATGVQGFTYDLRTVILPFMFFFNPQLLLIDLASWYQGVWVIFTALAGMLAFTTAVQGYLVTRMVWLERIPVMVFALMMIKPGWATDLPAMAVMALLYLYHRHRSIAAGGPSAPFGRGSYPAGHRHAVR